MKLGLERVDHLLMGSVSTGLVHNAPCRVAVPRAEEASAANQNAAICGSKAAGHLRFPASHVGVQFGLRLRGARKRLSTAGLSCRARGRPMPSAVAIMRHSVAIGAMTVAVTMLAGGAPLAYGAPGSVAGPTGGSSNNGGSSGNGGGSHGAQPTTPTVKLPPPAIINAQTVVQTAPPPPPVNIPPPVIDVQQPIIPNIPVEPQPPDIVPVNVVPSDVPVAPVPAEIPLLPPPPAAPPAPVSTPVSRVLLTSSAEPGTQALTLIVLFMACGCWIYGNRIGSQITVGKKERAAAGA
jgi:hypothetical protein